MPWVLKGLREEGEANHNPSMPHNGIFPLKGASLETDASFNIHELATLPVLTLPLEHLNQWLKDVHLITAKHTHTSKIGADTPN